MGLNKREPKTYVNILSKDGTLRVRANESDYGQDPQVVKRDYELQNGNKGTKYERVYHELSGFIQDIKFFDGEFGRSLHVVIKDADREEFILSLNIQTNYAEDMMKKIPNLDFSKEITFKPFSFEDDRGKVRKGVSINQGGEKIKSFFHDEKSNPLNGFPAPEKENKEMDKDDWKMYFMKTKKFLQEYLENTVIPNLGAETTDNMEGKEVSKEEAGFSEEEGEDAELDVKNVPF